MAIAMFRDGGTIQVMINDELIVLFDNRIGSKTRGRAVWYNTWGIPVPKSKVVEVCAAVRNDMSNWSNIYQSNKRTVEDFLKRLEEDYESVYAVPDLIVQIPSSKPSLTLKHYSSLGQLPDDQMRVVQEANDYGIRLVKRDEVIGIYIPEVYTNNLIKINARVKVTHMMGYTFLHINTGDLEIIIEWLSRVLKRIKSGI